MMSTLILMPSASVNLLSDCDTKDYDGDCGRDCDSSDENETSTNPIREGRATPY